MSVVIIGAGPAGLFSALSLIEEGIRDIVIIEEGRDLEERIRWKERRETPLKGEPGPLLAGFGGAGAFSDGKLIISTHVGGNLGAFLEQETLIQLIEEVNAIFLSLGAPTELYGEESERLERLKRSAQLAGLELVQTRIRHLGTDGCQNVLRNLRSRLRPHIELITETKAVEILAEKGAVKGVVSDKGRRFDAEFVIAAPGRVGAPWMAGEAKRLMLSFIPSPVDIGVRVEVPAEVTREITDVAYEAKLIYYSRTFDDRVRTFCMNPYGEVVMEQNGNLLTVNGHSYKGRRSDNTNFAILVSTTFTEPFDDPISYGMHIGALANLLGKGVIIQRLGDLHEGRRSTPSRIGKSIVRPTLYEATPGDLSFVLPYRYLKDIMEMLEALDHLAAGINSAHTLLYGVEVKFYSHRLKVTSSMESDIKNLFAVGDGAGISRGLMQAAVSGLIAGRAVARRIKGGEEKRSEAMN